MCCDGTMNESPFSFKLSLIVPAKGLCSREFCPEHSCITCVAVIANSCCQSQDPVGPICPLTLQSNHHNLLCGRIQCPTSKASFKKAEKGCVRRSCLHCAGTRTHSQHAEMHRCLTVAVMVLLPTRTNPKLHSNGVQQQQQCSGHQLSAHCSVICMRALLCLTSKMLSVHLQFQICAPVPGTATEGCSSTSLVRMERRGCSSPALMTF